MNTPGSAKRAIVVDDQTALLAALGALDRPHGTTIVTTYGWQQRILGAFVAPRSTQGQLQRIAALAAASAATVLSAVSDPDPSDLVIADPRVDSVAIARARVRGSNSLAAETIAAARAARATVRVGAGNSIGHIAERVKAAGIDFGIWDPAAPSRSTSRWRGPDVSST